MIRAHVLKRFELYIACMTLVFVAVIVALVWTDASTAFSIAATALGMGGILSAIQWADRERQRRLRARAIVEIREMLADQVLNQLSAVKMWVAETPDPAALDLILRETDDTIDRVADMITGLSEEQLDTWRLTYANVADHVAFSSEPGLA